MIAADNDRRAILLRAVSKTHWWAAFRASHVMLCQNVNGRD